MKRILVVANRTCPCPVLLDAVAERADGGGAVLLVAPALNSRLKHWVSDTDASLAQARERVVEAIQGLAERGVQARGEVGDAEPLHAIEDALVTFAAEEIVIGTHPAGESHWLEKGLVEEARERFDAPITHVESRYGLVSTES